jgi:hypothetical protein
MEQDMSSTHRLSFRPDPPALLVIHGFSCLCGLGLGLFILSASLQELFVALTRRQGRVSTRALTSSFGWSHAQAFEQQDVQELSR